MSFALRTAPTGARHAPGAALTTLALLAAGCATATGGAAGRVSGSSDPTERAAADGLDADRGMAAAVAALDLPAFAAHVAEDGIFFGRRGAAAGRAAVAASWAPFFAPGGPRMAWVPDRALASPSGELVFTFGGWTLTTPEGAPAATGRYLTAWWRDPDGLLRVALDGGDDPLPPLPPAVTRRSLRTLASRDGTLHAEGGLLLDGERETGWYLRLSRREGAGFTLVSEGGLYRQAAP